MLLIVDDHADTRSVLIKLLRRDGYEAVGADCGDAALETLKTLKPQLIILDCHMPDMDGLTVLHMLREDARLRDIPVIMFSAADGDEAQQALRLGAKDFIRKGSLDWPRLQAAINKHLTSSAA
jgi:CheY-like chemotaxis protein